MTTATKQEIFKEKLREYLAADKTVLDYINFFIPSLKCVEKTRILFRKIRKYDTAQTAYQQVLVLIA